MRLIFRGYKSEAQSIYVPEEAQRLLLSSLSAFSPILHLVLGICSTIGAGHNDALMYWIFLFPRSLLGHHHPAAVHKNIRVAMYHLHTWQRRKAQPKHTWMHCCCWLAGVMDRVRAVGTETEFKLHLFSWRCGCCSYSSFILGLQFIRSALSNYTDDLKFNLNAKVNL